MKFLKLTLPLAMCFLLGSNSALAATATDSVEVSTTVNGNCVLASNLSLPFTNYDTNFTSQMRYAARATITVRCTAGSSNVLISLDQGLHPGEGSTDEMPLRRMSSGDSFLNYNVFHDVLGSSVWGRGGNADSVIEQFDSSLVPVVRTGYLVARGGQDVPMGTYTDTVGVHLTF